MVSTEVPEMCGPCQSTDLPLAIIVLLRVRGWRCTSFLNEGKLLAPWTWLPVVPGDMERAKAVAKQSELEAEIKDLLFKVAALESQLEAMKRYP